MRLHCGSGVALQSACLIFCILIYSVAKNYQHGGIVTVLRGTLVDWWKKQVPLRPCCSARTVLSSRPLWASAAAEDQDLLHKSSTYLGMHNNWLKLQRPCFPQHKTTVSYVQYMGLILLLLCLDFQIPNTMEHR